MGALWEGGGETGDTLGVPYPSVPDIALYMNGDTCAGVGMETDGDDDARGGIVVDCCIGLVG